VLVDQSLREQLRSISPRVIVHETSATKINANFNNENSSEDNSRWRFTGTKLGVFNLTTYDRILYLDSDTFMLRNADNVFCDVSLSNSKTSFSFAASSESHPPVSAVRTRSSHDPFDDGHPSPAKFAGQEAKEAKARAQTFERAPPRVNLYSSVFLVRPSSDTFTALLELLRDRLHRHGGAFSDQVLGIVPVLFCRSF